MPAMSRLESAFCASAPWDAVAARLVLPWALQARRPAGDALEVGAGDGAMAARVLDAFPDLRLTVTDVDPNMIERARHRLDGRAQAHVADASALPFADQSFDTALCFLMLHHVPDWERVLAELARVLRPGGWLIAYDLLDRWPNRAAHAVTRSEGIRLPRASELRAALAPLPLAPVRLRAGRLLFRLTAERGRPDS